MTSFPGKTAGRMLGRIAWHRRRRARCRIVRVRSRPLHRRNAGRMMGDVKRSAPAVARNREPLLDVLRQVLPPSGTLFEVGSGTGEHCVFFAAALSHWVFAPSDREEANLASIEAWRLESGLANVLPARRVDVTRDDWGIDPVDVVFSANLIHIAPPEAMLGLTRGAARHLRPGGLLITYGPYRVHGRHTAPSNEQFDAWLKQQDPRFGVRDQEELTSLASEVGLSLEQTFPMPANNFTLIFRKTGSGGGSS